MIVGVICYNLTGFKNIVNGKLEVKAAMGAGTAAEKKQAGKGKGKKQG